MSFVDDTFKTLPAQLLNQFGIDITYIKAAASQTYNATTGEVGGSDTNVSMKALITSVTATELPWSVYVRWCRNFSTTSSKRIICHS